MNCLKLLVALLVVGVTAAEAQHQHNSGMVYGREHPEQLTRDVAFGIFLEHRADVAPHSDVLLGLLQRARLGEDDHQKALDVISEFAERFEALKQAHNRAVELGRTSPAPFWSGFDVLVDQANDGINTKLSRDGATAFWAFIDGERGAMGLSEEHPRLKGLVAKRPVTIEVASLEPMFPAGQGGIIMQTHYSVYSAMTLNIQSTIAASTAILDTSLSGTAYCSITILNGQCPGILHTGHVSLTVNGTAHTTRGTGVAPAAYIYVDQPVTIPLSTFEAGPVTASASDGVDCTSGGVNYFTALPWPWSLIETELAFTINKSSHSMAGISPQGIPGWNVTNPCSTRTEPPDDPVSIIRANTDAVDPTGWLSMAACARLKGSHTPWVCSTWLQGAFPGWPSTIALPWRYDTNYDCTNKDAGFNGWPIPFPPGPWF
jgi:hypothetical protein